MSQVLALFSKLCRKISIRFKQIKTQEIEQTTEILSSHLKMPVLSDDNEESDVSMADVNGNEAVDMDDSMSELEEQGKKEKKRRKKEDPRRSALNDEQWQPVAETLDDELNQAGNEKLRQLQQSMLNDRELQKYRIDGVSDAQDAEAWKEAERKIRKSGKSGSGLVSVAKKKHAKEESKARQGEDGSAVARVMKEAEKISQKHKKSKSKHR